MIKRLLFFLVFISSIFSSLSGQNDNYFTYSLSEGLPQSQVFALAKDNKGYIWAGTQGGGIARYDGNEFKVLTTQNGLNSDFVNAIVFDDKNENIIVGTSRGLNTIQNSKIKSFSFSNEQQPNITSLCVLDNILFCGTSNGVLLQNLSVGKEILDSKFSVLKNCYINDVKKINNEIWFGTNKGLWIYNSLKKTIYKSNKTPQPNVAQIHLDNKNHVWLSILDYGIIKINPERNSIVTKISNDEIKKSLSLYTDENNYLWIATQYNGLYKYNINSNELEIVKDKDFTTTKLRTILKDDWGNFWIGTSGEGLLKKASQAFKHFYPTDYGLKSNKIYSLSKFDNQILMSTGDNNLYTFDESKSYGQFEKIYSASSNAKIKSIAVDSFKNVWIGTEGNGLVQIIPTGERIIYSYSNANFTDDIITQVLIDKKGNLWIATNSSGISNYKNGMFITYNSKKGLEDDYINGLAVDTKNNVWYVTKKGGLGYINSNNQIKKINTKSQVKSQSIKSIVIDNADNVFFSIIGDGLYKYQANRNTILKVKSNTQKFSNNIFSMATTPNGNLWLGAERGCYELSFDKGDNLEHVKYYSKGDGFLGLENCHNSILHNNNQVWFGTMNGFSYINLGETKSDKQRPSIHLNETLLFYKPIGETKYGNVFYKSKTLPYDQNHISFHFKAIHLDHSDKIKYRFKLEGADQNWSSWENNEEVNYANLPPATYKFLVQSSLDGLYPSNILEVPFTIDTPFWQKWWFRLLSVSLVLTGIIYYFRSRENKIKEREAIKHKELEMQNQLLSLEQKALQLQMNPHFIFNALNSIQSVIVDQDVDKARLEIQNFALLMRSILNNSRKKTISIDEELQTIRKYLELEQFCQKNKFDYEISIDENLSTEDMEIPSMLLQPYIENAVIHGISHLKHRGKIDIKFTLEVETLICEITDNGVGRIKAKELSFGSKSHVSLGMEVTETRLLNYAENKIDNPQSIIDLYDANGNAIGTKVILKIPITSTY